MSEGHALGIPNLGCFGLTVMHGNICTIVQCSQTIDRRCHSFAYLTIFDVTLLSDELSSPLLLLGHLGLLASAQFSVTSP